jgi:alkylation response protein AidB-like acyl-CoA dehydrogenase
VFADTVAYCRVREVSGGPLTSLQHTRFVLAELATELAVARTFTDRCLQLHGGYGYTHELAVGRAFVDSRVQTIYGGTTEVMKETIAQSLI